LCNKKLIVLFKKDLLNIFTYVKEKYDSNYIKLYEGNVDKLCKICNNRLSHKNKSGNCIKCIRQYNINDDGTYIEKIKR
jgi:hypothetical protein